MKKYLFSELIEEITELNTELLYGLDDIVGVTIEKGLIPTIANLTKTELNKFYIVKPDTFVFNPRTHGVRLGMGYNDTENTYITSWNNVAFKVKDEARTLLNPEYLWLYFNRTEWDRETNYHAWGSSTIVFSWNTFRNLSIKLPEKEVQDKIVRQYKVIKNRIKLKKQINDNLEAMLTAVYFEQFYSNKASEYTKLSDLMVFSNGKSRPKTNGTIPVYGGNGVLSYTDKYNAENTVLIGRVGAYCGSVYLEQSICWVSDNAIFAKSKITNDEFFDYFLLKELNLFNHHVGTGQQLLTQDILNNIEVSKPDIEHIGLFNRKAKSVFEIISANKCEIIRLQKLSDLLLARLAS